jgi:hypothetical protein
MLARQGYRFSPAAREALAAYVARRRRQPLFGNARSVRNALDRARLRQASRLLATASGAVTASDLSLIDAPDILASRVFAPEPAGRSPT